MKKVEVFYLGYFNLRLVKEWLCHECVDDIQPVTVSVLSKQYTHSSLKEELKKAILKESENRDSYDPILDKGEQIEVFLNEGFDVEILNNNISNKNSHNFGVSL